MPVFRVLLCASNQTALQAMTSGKASSSLTPTNTQPPPHDLAPSYGWNPSIARLRARQQAGKALAALVVPQTGIHKLKPEIWQSILLNLPIGTFWTCRAVCHAWQEFIEAYVLANMLGRATLALIDEDPSEAPLTLIPHPNFDDPWVEYSISGVKHDASWLPTLHLKQPKLSKDGMALVIAGRRHTIRVTIPGVGNSPEARRIRYDEKTKLVRVDWKVLLCTVAKDPAADADVPLPASLLDSSSEDDVVKTDEQA